MMSSSLLRVAARQGARVSQRAIATTTVNNTAIDQLSQAEKDSFYPKVGNRDIVGHGFNGNPVYMDREEYPAPAIRFKENTPELMALREKEKGDWKNLTLEEKKTLYRASFCQTYAEMKAPSGEWKAILAGTLLGFSVTGWVLIWMKKYVYPKELPRTITREWQEKELENMVRQRQGPIEGISSHWDYEKGEWKK